VLTQPLGAVVHFDRVNLGRHDEIGHAEATDSVRRAVHSNSTRQTHMGAESKLSEGSASQTGA
jgi:hypothetical protein